MRKKVLFLPSFDPWADDVDGAFGDAEGTGYLVVGAVQFVLEDEEGDLLRCQGVVDR